VQTVSAVKPSAGAATVIWHSVMTQYLPPSEQDALDAAFSALGALATPDAPVARLGFEANKYPSPAGVVFGLKLQTWPGGETTTLASAHPHGDPVMWHRI
jgi:hypothetical protein